MPPSPEPSPSPPSRGPRFHFSLLFIAMLAICVAAAAASYMFQSFGKATGVPVRQRLTFLLVTFAAPVIAMVVLSGLLRISRWLRRRRRS